METNRNITIQKLSKQQAKEIYEQHMSRDFPKDEIKPWKSIERMWDMGAYQGLGMFGDAALLGYAFFAKEPGADVCLLDYFAMMEKCRGQGLGGTFLGRMKEVLEGYRGILFETEDEDAATDEQQLKVRRRRNAFYEREGMQKTDIRTSVYDVRYMIWMYPFDGNMMDSDQCRKKLADIYRIMIPGEKFDKHVIIL